MCLRTSSDSGPELIAIAPRERMAAVGGKTTHIEPRSSCENGYCESERGAAQRLEILRHERGPDRHRELALPLQRGASTLIAGIPTTGARGTPLAIVKTRGANAIYRLTFPLGPTIQANPSWCSHA